MKYKDKEYTSEEFLALMEQRDRELAEAQDENKKLKEATPAAPAAPAAPVTPAAPAAPAAPVAPVADVKLSERDAEVKKLAEQNESMRKQLSELAEDKRKNTVNEILRQFEDKGVPPAVIAVARENMKGDMGEAKLYTFSENGKEVKRSLTDCIAKVLDAVSTIELGETTVLNNNGRSDIDGDQASDVDTVKKYAEEHKVDFMTAYRKCLADKKVKEVRVVA